MSPVVEGIHNCIECPIGERERGRARSEATRWRDGP